MGIIINCVGKKARCNINITRCNIFVNLRRWRVIFMEIIFLCFLVHIFNIIIVSTFSCISTPRHFYRINVLYKYLGWLLRFTTV